MLPKSWKKSLINGLIIPTKMRFCKDCIKEKCCDRCNNQIIENKEFEANLYLSKRQRLNQFGHMFPFFKE